MAATLEGLPAGGVPGGRRLRSVPAAAGVSERPARHPLSLGRDVRARLRGAVHALLEAPGLEGVSDSVRLAVLVLASRKPAEADEVLIRRKELGRWIGLAERTVSSVTSGLRGSSVATVETEEGEFCQADGLRCEVLPMSGARGVIGHPLALSKKELALFQQLMEAVMGPGWTHRDGRVSPAGLIGARSGHGAATDRLALLLLVLEARENGHVRLCGGTVDTHTGRAAATLARLMGCTPAGAAGILKRLENQELVFRPRAGTGSNLKQRTHLVVPAVAAAHGHTRAALVREGRVQAPKPVFSDPAVTARPSEPPAPDAQPQVNGVPKPRKADFADPAATAPLHTDHSHLETWAVPPTVRTGFSGEADQWSGDLPGRACGREDGPLRGEQPEEFPAYGDERASQAAASVSGRPQAVRLVKAHQQRGSLPDDLGVRVALEPVTGLWEQLSDGQQNLVEAAAKAELEQLAGLLVQPDAAPRLLAGRLTDRLQETGGEALVKRPFPWLIRRGLVQRQACTDPRCDDSIRLDSGGDCDTCHTVIDFKRAHRARAAARIDKELPDLPDSERRQVLEEQLREAVAAEADEVVRRHAQVAVERAERAKAQQAAREQAERDRAAAAAADAARQAEPCRTCGAPDAAGHCELCAGHESVQRLLTDAVDLAVAVRADLTDPAATRALLEQCENDTRQLVAAKAGERPGDGDAAAALRVRAELQLVRRIRIQRRQAALHRLCRAEAAVAEGDAAYEGHRAQFPLAPQDDAQMAARAAEQQMAEQLLNQRLDRLANLKAERLPTAGRESLVNRG
ncbi:hypothetical protein ACOKM5_43535 [Streptomyces sp. BH097]|uniref:hypothetical protein n=1 Tax=unclassified Streptomyces TaxID=2593676 RepID=UPI003BB5C432